MSMEEKFSKNLPGLPHNGIKKLTKNLYVEKTVNFTTKEKIRSKWNGIDGSSENAIREQ